VKQAAGAVDAKQHSMLESLLGLASAGVALPFTMAGNSLSRMWEAKGLTNVQKAWLVLRTLGMPSLVNLTRGAAATLGGLAVARGLRGPSPAVVAQWPALRDETARDFVKDLNQAIKERLHLDDVPEDSADARDVHRFLSSLERDFLRRSKETQDVKELAVLWHMTLWCAQKDSRCEKFSDYQRLHELHSSLSPAAKKLLKTEVEALKQEEKETISIAQKVGLAMALLLALFVANPMAFFSRSGGEVASSEGAAIPQIQPPSHPSQVLANVATMLKAAQDEEDEQRRTRMASHDAKMAGLYAEAKAARKANRKAAREAERERQTAQSAQLTALLVSKLTKDEQTSGWSLLQLATSLASEGPKLVLVLALAFAVYWWNKGLLDMLRHVNAMTETSTANINEADDALQGVVSALESLQTKRIVAVQALVRGIKGRAIANKTREAKLIAHKAAEDELAARVERQMAHAEMLKKQDAENPREPLQGRKKEVTAKAHALLAESDERKKAHQKLFADNDAAVSSFQRRLADGDKKSEELQKKSEALHATAKQARERPAKKDFVSPYASMRTTEHTEPVSQSASSASPESDRHEEVMERARRRIENLQRQRPAEA